MLDIKDLTFALIDISPTKSPIFLQLLQSLLCKFFPDICGYSDVENTVSDSETNLDFHWPWMSSIGDYENETWRHICGATLITERHFLTSAHCANIG